MISLAAQLVVFQDSRRRVVRLEKQMVYHILRTADVVGLTQDCCWRGLTILG
jgi:uncharacterized Fe-S cluster-containing radical SAM superfamily protein